MSAYELASIIGIVVGLVGGTLVARRFVRKPPAERRDPQCTHLDADRHRCILLSGHTDAHEVLALYRRDAPRG